MTTLNEPPVTVVADYFTALAEGRVDDVLGFLDPHVTWYQPGANRFSGVHHGRDAVGALIGGMMTVSQGTFALAVTGPLMPNGEVVAAPVHFVGDRGEATLDQGGIDLMTVRDGKVVEVRLFSSDGPAEDAFWGSMESVES